MTRVICVAPLIDSARLFMQSELGWEIDERDELGADSEAAVAIVREVDGCSFALRGPRL